MELFRDLNRYNRDGEFRRYRQSGLDTIIIVLTLAGILFVVGWQLVDHWLDRENTHVMILFRVISVLIFLSILIFSLITKGKVSRKALIYGGFYCGIIFSTLMAAHTGGPTSHYYIALNFMLITWLVLIPFGYGELILNGLIFITFYNIFLNALDPGSVHTGAHFEIDSILGGSLFIGSVIAIYNNRMALKLFLNERLIRSAEERNRLLIDSLQEGLFVIQEGKFTFLNNAIVRIVDYTVGELLGEDFLKVIAPADREMVRENHIKRTRGEYSPSSYEATLLKKDGKTTVPVILSVTLSVFNGRPAVVGTAKDITDIKATQEAVRESERRLNAIFETAIIGIAEDDKGGRLLSCNQHWFELFGYSREEMVGMTVADITAPEDQSLIDEQIKLMYTGEADHLHFERKCRRKDGTYFWGYVSLNPIRNEKGEVETIVATLFDLTERKLIEEELLHTQELLRTESRQLQKENLRSQFEMLKSQVNPHFLFNSLNVLTSLIKLDPDLAEKFAEQMAKVYRYVLEHREEDLVSLRSEIDFIRSYIFLLEIRFRDKVKVEVNIPEGMMEMSVAPLALQLLIENAVKHNTFSRKQPLVIEIFTDDDQYLHVVNNLQRREMKIEGTGVGLMNIEARFRHLTDRPPYFGERGDRFVARIPLLNEKNY